MCEAISLPFCTEISRGIVEEATHVGTVYTSVPGLL